MDSSDDEKLENGYQKAVSPELEEPFRERCASDLLNRIISDEFLRAITCYSFDPEHDRYYQELGTYLRRRSDDFEKQLRLQRSTSLDSYTFKTKDILEKVSPGYVKKYRILVQRFDEWKTNRGTLIQKLSNCINFMDRNSKISTAVRFVSASIDISGSMGGLLLRSKSDWAGFAMNVASFSGLCGLVSTVSEVEMTRRILEDVSKCIEYDLHLLKSVVKWFEKETADLDSLVQDLFPHGIDRDIVQVIHDASAEHDYYLKVFRAALVSNVRRDINLIENRDFLHSLQLFAKSEIAPLWWNRIIYKRDPILLDFGRMALQMEFGQTQSIIFQCISTLPLEQQRLGSVPVAGRIILNLLTMYDSFTSLTNGARSKYSDKLRKQVNRLESELEDISNLVQAMNPKREQA